MSKREFIIIILIAFFVGAIGSIVLGRFFIPYAANVIGWEPLNKLVTNSPIIINRTNEIHLNDGVNLIDLAKQSSNITVSLYRGLKPKLTFAGLGIIMSSDGLIFTSKRTIGGNREMTVVLNDGTSHVGLVRAVDPKSDLVIVTVNAKNLSSTTFGPSFDLKAGQRALTLGVSNNRFERKLNSGLVTNSILNNKYLDQVFNSERLSDFFATDLSFDANYSGAPILNLDGKLVGMVANDQDEMIIAENLQTALNSYLQTGKIIRPKLGIQYWSLSNLTAGLKNFPRAGIVVLSSDQNSLRQNDFIYEVDGQTFEDTTFEQMLNSKKPDGQLHLKFLRGSEEMETTITLKPTQ